MRNNLFLVAVFVVILVASCGKKNDNSLPTGTIYSTYSSMDTIYGMLGLQPKVITFDAGAGGTFYGNSGARYIFQPGCFQDGSGASVTGNVQITVTEYLKKGDMIFSGILPVSNGDALISGGEIAVTASQGGQPIYLKPGYTFQATILPVTKADSNMSFFAGLRTTSATNKIYWALAGDSVGHNAVVYNGDTISLFSDSIRYCNADRFMINPNYQTFTVSVLVSGTAPISALSQLSAYALYDSVKGLWPLTELSNNTFSVSHVPSIPVHFVAFGLINGHFYGGVIAATPANGINYNVSLTEVDPIAFKGQINALYQ